MSVFDITGSPHERSEECRRAQAAPIRGHEYPTC
jgi:hypothetical protein